jgi:DUF971 family protein
MWDDGHEGVSALKTLRDGCPCAGCQGETVLLHHYDAPAKDSSAPGMYELRGAETIGNYAIKLSWGDGHDMGIYTWEHLRSLCECSACSGRRTRVPGEKNADE